MTPKSLPAKPPDETMAQMLARWREEAKQWGHWSISNPEESKHAHTHTFNQCATEASAQHAKLWALMEEMPHVTTFCKNEDCNELHGRCGHESAGSCLRCKLAARLGPLPELNARKKEGSDV